LRVMVACVRVTPCKCSTHQYIQPHCGTAHSSTSLGWLASFTRLLACTSIYTVTAAPHRSTDHELCHHTDDVTHPTGRLTMNSAITLVAPCTFHLHCCNVHKRRLDSTRLTSGWRFGGKSSSNRKFLCQNVR
jgi:hypothetical protein